MTTLLVALFQLAFALAPVVEAGSPPPLALASEQGASCRYLLETGAGQQSRGLDVLRYLLETGAGQESRDAVWPAAGASRR